MINGEITQRNTTACARARVNYRVQFCNLKVFSALQQAAVQHKKRANPLFYCRMQKVEFNIIDIIRQIRVFLRRSAASRPILPPLALIRGRCFC